MVINIIKELCKKLFGQLLHILPKGFLYLYIPLIQTFLKGFRFSFFAKNVSRNIGKNISKNLINNRIKNLLIMLNNMLQMHLKLFRK